jgi:hypothetical protein
MVVSVPASAKGNAVLKLSWLERYVDIVEVTGSSPVSPTTTASSFASNVIDVWQNNAPALISV